MSECHPQHPAQACTRRLWGTAHGALQVAPRGPCRHRTHVQSSSQSVPAAVAKCTEWLASHLFLAVLEAGKSKVMVLVEARASWFADGHLPAVSSCGRRGEGPVRGLCCEDLDPTQTVLTSGPDHLSKTPPPNTTPLGVWVQPMDLGGNRLQPAAVANCPTGYSSERGPLGFSL